MIVIPQNPTSAGQLHVDLDLSTDGWQGLTCRLQGVLADLRAQNSKLVPAGEANDHTSESQQGIHIYGLPAVQPLSDANDRSSSRLKQPFTANARQAAPDPSMHAASAKMPPQAAASQHSPPSRPAQQTHQPARPPSALPTAVQALLSTSAQPPSQVGQRVQEKALVSERPAQVPPASSEQILQQQWDTAPVPTQAPAPLEAGGWTVVWHTDEQDSDRLEITGLVHVPGLPGLAGGDGHAGYLVTAASQWLNLYECSASGGRGEASLQLLHQLGAETHTSMLAATVSNLLLLASAQDMGKPTHCVVMHSLNQALGLFEPQGRVPLPPIGSPVPKATTLMQHKPQVASLHGMGKALEGCCAASFGASLVVYNTRCEPGDIPKPKASWQKHSAPVTRLHASEHTMQLWSGAQDGSMHAYDMRYKPSEPVIQLQQTGAVKALRLVEEHTLLSGSTDGSLHFWDVQNRQKPEIMRILCMPDFGGVTASALGPFGDLLVVGTDKGDVFAVSLGDKSYSITLCARLGAEISDVCWNMGSGEIYAATGACVAVLRQN